MAHNQTRLPLLSAILELEQFSIQDLSLYTGLSPSQIYRPIAELKEEGFLTSRRKDGEPNLARRPKATYELTSDESKRTTLRNELDAFLPASQRRSSSRLERVRQLTGNIALKLLEVPSLSLEDVNFDGWCSEVKAELNAADRELKRAAWSSSSDLRDGPPENEFSKLQKHLTDLRQRFEAAEREERQRRDRKAAYRNWRHEVEYLIAYGKQAIAAQPGSEKTVPFTRICQRDPSKSVLILNFEKALCEDFFSAKGREGDWRPAFAKALAKQAILAGSSWERLDVALRSVREDSRIGLTRAQCSYEARRFTDAYKEWQIFVEGQPSSAHSGVLYAALVPEKWEEIAGDLTGEIVRTADASLAAYSFKQLRPHTGLNVYSIKPRLYNPLCDVGPDQPELLDVPDDLLTARLSVATTALEKLPLAGIDAVCLANALWRRGFAPSKAWDVAMEPSAKENVTVTIKLLPDASAAQRREISETFRAGFGLNLQSA
jgi:DNA-binding PadR family transcriptional regulator